MGGAAYAETARDAIVADELRRVRFTQRTEDLGPPSAHHSVARTRATWRREVELV
jgi:hypothetical protein